MRNLIIAAGLLASLLGTRGAFAQDAAASGSASTSSNSNANVGVSLPGAATTSTAAAGTSDHDQMVGRLAVGYFGIANTGAGANGGPGPNDSPYAVTGLAPVVGVRYWLDPMIGIDVGLGMSIVGGTLDDGVDGTPNQDRQSFSAFLIHAGVPLALASASHFTFEVIPELNVGFAGSGTNNPDPMVPGEIKHSGFHFDLGARAGAEVHFGFMGLPQLSLIGSIGLRFDSDKGSTENNENATQTKVKTSSSRSEFHTTVGSNPWAIFTNQVAAMYYF